MDSSYWFYGISNRDELYQILSNDTQHKTIVLLRSDPKLFVPRDSDIANKEANILRQVWDLLRFEIPGLCYAARVSWMGIILVANEQAHVQSVLQSVQNRIAAYFVSIQYDWNIALMRTETSGDEALRFLEDYVSDLHKKGVSGTITILANSPD